MNIGIVFDLFDDYPWEDGDAPDLDAEYEPDETIQSLEAAIRILGHEPVRIGTARRLLDRLPDPGIDAAVNISESFGSRNREAHAPILLELANIPCTGSDAMTLSVSLDKALTKDLARLAGIPTPDWTVLRASDPVESIDLPAPWPLFIKPRYEGAAMGILPENKCFTFSELRNRSAELFKRYSQDLLAEVFIEGSEFTVAVVGNGSPQALPVLQRAVETHTGIGLHALERKGVDDRDWSYHTPGSLTTNLERELQAAALAVYKKLECRDFARMDFRVDTLGNLWFLEVNTLPTFDPAGTFGVLAELEGTPYPTFVARLLEHSFRRMNIPVSSIKG